jgi:hypothetical protein
MPNTRGFKGLELLQHHSEHRAEFGMVALAEYAQMADEFWMDPKPAHVHECTRPLRKDVLRFDPTTDTFGCMDVSGYIRTFFKPVPCASLPAAQAAAWKRLGKCHRWPDNLTYFREGCKLW